MATLNLLGLPSNAKLPKLIIVLKSMLKKEGIIKFWVKEMSDIRGTDFKSAKVEFYSGDEAYRALTVMDGFEFSIGQSSYPVTASLDEEERSRPRRRSPSPYNRRPREREYRDRYEEPRYSRYDGYSRERSRSPVHRDSSKLDLEIELLRKQRMIIEEERRLLLERKKLELVKEFGPSALKEFKSFEDDRERDRRYRPERPAEYRPRRRSPPLPPRISKPAPRQWGQKDRVQLPQFHVPCKILLEELKELMEKLGTRKESFLLTKLIRATLRKRLAVALEGKPIMPGAKIVALYRQKYPKHQDEDFIKRHLKDIRACHMPSKGNDNKASVKTEEKDEKVKEEKEGQEKNGDNENEDEGQELDTEPDDADIKTESDEPEPSEEPNHSTDTQVLETQGESSETDDVMQAETERAECNRSVGSSEALTLHDKNYEDWVEGEQGWDDGNEQATEQ
ncbi:hypothetical protein O0L34_g18770 [Tuta absoluta]|nr:hypothetical protein O0L34_g18770 [Tuta absoluta]